MQKKEVWHGEDSNCDFRSDGNCNRRNFKGGVKMYHGKEKIQSIEEVESNRIILLQICPTSKVVYCL